jgi:hypothetical protein
LSAIFGRSISKPDKRTALRRLGKALFWDMQVGGDGIRACASCHYHAGADNRKINQMSPGLKMTLGGDWTCPRPTWPRPVILVESIRNGLFALSLCVALPAYAGGPPAHQVAVGADVGTTAAGLAAGFSELNPAAAPLLPLRVFGPALARKHATTRDCVDITHSITITSLGAAAWNLGVIATGATGVGLPLAAAGAAASWDWSAKHARGYCGAGSYELPTVTLHTAEELEHVVMPGRVDYSELPDEVLFQSTTAYTTATRTRRMTSWPAPTPPSSARVSRP